MPPLGRIVSFYYFTICVLHPVGLKLANGLESPNPNRRLLYIGCEQCDLESFHDITITSDESLLELLFSPCCSEPATHTCGFIFLHLIQRVSYINPPHKHRAELFG